MPINGSFWCDIDDPNNFKQADYILFSQRYKKEDLVYLQKLIELANQNRKKLILETGSGSGLVTKSYNSKIICTDFSFEMCKESKQKQEFVVCCDAEFLPFKKNIMSIHVKTFNSLHCVGPFKVNDSSSIMRKSISMFLVQG